MGRWLWPLVLLLTFAGGWAAATVTGIGPAAVRDAEQHATVTRLQQQIDTLQARLRAREDVAATRQAGDTASRLATVDSPRARDLSVALARRAQDEHSQPSPQIDRTTSSPRVTSPASAPTVQAALDHFDRYLELMNDSASGRERWRQAREVIDELRAMGPAGEQALMHVLAAGNDSDERRAAARLLGQLRVGAALPLLRDIIDHDTDVLLRRAAAAGLRQLQTPESLPVMERMVVNAGEDRFVRLSAAVGLAESGRPLGVSGLTHIFEESTADGRGRDLTFRALASLKDERPLPFMRQVAASPVEPSYRLQAIRYLSTQRDRQALVTLQLLMNAPTEQPSIRDAAAQAYATINTTPR